ncbi:MAG: c-type cytochrome, partial [Gammaproteobacteria bacterium]|nr:c-type cytochrome [Gammaproteobacteria bacterium]
TYLVDGEQYISVAAGWGGIYALAPGEIGLLSGRLGNKSRILAFKLGGQARLPEAEPLAPLVFTPPATEASGDEVQHGKFLYHRHCVACHGDAAVSAGMLPDLRATPMLHGDAFQSVVLGGALVDRGMVSFAEELDENGVEAIRAYLVARAHESAALAGQVE